MFIVAFASFRLFAPHILGLVGEVRFAGLVSSYKWVWPKFAIESDFLALNGSRFFFAYCLAQVIFPFVSVLLLLVLAPLVWRQIRNLDSDRIAWRLAGLPFIALGAVYITYIVLFDVMATGQGKIAHLLYQTSVFQVWMPLMYASIVSVWLRFSLAVTNQLLRL